MALHTGSCLGMPTWVSDAMAVALDDSDVKSAISDGEKRLNGHGRLLIRSSGTEPVIRVMGEGEDRIRVEDVVDTIVSALGQAAA